MTDVMKNTLESTEKLRTLARENGITTSQFRDICQMFPTIQRITYQVRVRGRSPEYVASKYKLNMEWVLEILEFYKDVIDINA